MADPSRLLIANRGEIAVRIARAAAAEGMTSVAVTAADEPDAAHLAAADESYVLPGSGPAAYMDVDALVQAALATGCGLLHPGYGFLSESTDLAGGLRGRRDPARRRDPLRRPRAPRSSAVLERQGAGPRRRGEARGVPVLRGTGADVDAAGRRRASSTRPAPSCSSRASAGAAGHTRVLRRGDDVAAAFAQRRRRGARRVRRRHCCSPRPSSSRPGTSRCRCSATAGETSSSSVTATARCSGRRQKIVEIAPAPDLPDDVRARLHEAAIDWPSAVGLRGLATVEFLVSADDPERFVFLECNPRLQVEHTVTEETSGLDLVRLQLRVATGATLADLGLADGAPRPLGWAVQARVNAETVTADGTLVPSAGTITSLALPGGPGVRVDTAARPGVEQSPRYDSLLAKVVVHERQGDLGDALRHLDRALAEVDVRGVATNTGFLRAVLGDPDVLAGRATTTLVDDRTAAAGRRRRRSPPSRSDTEQAPRPRRGRPPGAGPRHRRRRRGDGRHDGRARGSGPRPGSDEDGARRRAPRRRHRPPRRRPRGRHGAAGRRARHRRALRRRRRGVDRRCLTTSTPTAPTWPRCGGATSRASTSTAPEAVGEAARPGPAHRPGEPRRPRRRGQLPRVRAARLRRPGAPPQPGGAAGAHPGRRRRRRAGRRQRRPGRTGAQRGRRRLLRLHRARRHPGHARPPQEGPAVRAGREAAAARRPLRRGRRRAARRHRPPGRLRARHRGVHAVRPALRPRPDRRHRQRPLLRRQRRAARHLRRHHRHRGREHRHGRPGDDRGRRPRRGRARGDRADRRPARQRRRRHPGRRRRGRRRRRPEVPLLLPGAGRRLDGARPARCSATWSRRTASGSTTCAPCCTPWPTSTRCSNSATAGAPG